MNKPRQQRRRYQPVKQAVLPPIPAPRTRPYIEQIVRIPKQPKNVTIRKVKRSSFDLNSVFTDILGSITKAVSNPTVLLTFAIALSMVVNHDFDAHTGYIYSTFSGKTDGFSTWVTTNAKKICGFLIFLPAVLDVPKDKRYIVAIASFLWVFLIPEYVFAEYLLQSLLLHTYFKVTSRSTRIALLVIAGFAWFSGYVTFKPIIATVAKNTTKH